MQPYYSEHSRLGRCPRIRLSAGEWEDTESIWIEGEYPDSDVKGEVERRAVMRGGTIERGSGSYLGSVSYIARKIKGGGTQYGWRPTKAAPQSSLRSMADAVALVIGSKS